MNFRIFQHSAILRVVAEAVVGTCRSPVAQSSRWFLNSCQTYFRGNVRKLGHFPISQDLYVNFEGNKTHKTPIRSFILIQTNISTTW